MSDNLKETIKQILEKFSMNAVHLTATDNNVFTKIGGQPLADKNFEWPKWNGQSLAFIMQIKLSEITLLSNLQQFPQEGLLYVFYDKEQSTWGGSYKDKGSWKIIFCPEHDDLHLVPYPQDIEDEYKYTEKKLGQTLIKTYPSEDDITMKHLTREQRLHLTHDQIDWCDDLAESAYGDSPRHQIGGIAYAIQDSDMDRECQLTFLDGQILASSGRNSIADYDSPEAKKELGMKRKELRKNLEKDSKDWILLLQVDSDDDAGMMWGDVGILYFWIRKDDLAQLNFENVWMILQCC
jgi:uncharacterized protein YwqG